MKTEIAEMAKATRRDIQKMRSTRYPVKTSVSYLQTLVLNRRYHNMKLHEMVEQAIEEAVNIQLAKEAKEIKEWK